jgi:hypothetical protein
LVVNEAACAATPVVMVDRKISQVVEEGVSGLFAANTPEDFGAKISLLLRQPELAAAMGRAARERAGKLTARAQAAELARLYEETAGRSRAARTCPALPPCLEAGSGGSGELGELGEAGGGDGSHGAGDRVAAA